MLNIHKYFKHILLAILSSLTTPLFANVQDEEAYCQQAGGTVNEMTVVFSTNLGPISGNSRHFCLFIVDNNNLTIGLESFAASQPSIAATYMKSLGEISPESPLWGGNQGNPSHNVCKNLGGTTISAVTSGSFTDSSGESDICVFGDGSMVSAWSLIYMANHRTGYDEIKEKVRAVPLNISMPTRSS